MTQRWETDISSSSGIPLLAFTQYSTVHVADGVIGSHTKMIIDLTHWQGLNYSCLDCPLVIFDGPIEILTQVAIVFNYSQFDELPSTLVGVTTMQLPLFEATTFNNVKPTLGLQLGQDYRQSSPLADLRPSCEETSASTEDPTSTSYGRQSMTALFAIDKTGCNLYALPLPWKKKQIRR